jgi:prolipoprotein diacylglyceryltransferase
MQFLSLVLKRLVAHYLPFTTFPYFPKVGPQTPMEHFHAFRSAINWTEPFILYLMAFHVIVFVLCMWASRPSRSLVPRVVIMICVGILVRSAERLNTYAAQNWEAFSTQNYFDSKGVFMGIFLCGPLLVDSFLMLVIFLREASQLLVQVKTAELKRKKAKTEESKKNN